MSESESERKLAAAGFWRGKQKVHDQFFATQRASVRKFGVDVLSLNLRVLASEMLTVEYKLLLVLRQVIVQRRP